VVDGDRADRRSGRCQLARGRLRWCEGLRFLLVVSGGTQDEAHAYGTVAGGSGSGAGTYALNRVLTRLWSTATKAQCRGGRIS